MDNFLKYKDKYLNSTLIFNYCTIRFLAETDSNLPSLIQTKQGPRHDIP